VRRFTERQGISGRTIAARRAYAIQALRPSGPKLARAMREGLLDAEMMRRIHVDHSKHVAAARNSEGAAP
jgi:hypothetical protein